MQGGVRWRSFLPRERAWPWQRGQGVPLPLWQPLAEGEGSEEIQVSNERWEVGMGCQVLRSSSLGENVLPRLARAQ